MLKKILAILVMLYAAAAFATVDVNKATAAELDGVKGIGPSISKAIVDERKKGDFKNWEDLITRVKGIGEGNAAKFSAEGLTVKGETFKKTADAKKDDKTAAAKPAASAAKPAASAAKPADAAAKPAASAAKK